MIMTKKWMGLVKLTRTRTSIRTRTSTRISIRMRTRTRTRMRTRMKNLMLGFLSRRNVDICQRILCSSGQI